MTTYYVGTGGSNSNSGLTWALRRLTLTSIETLVAAGDTVNIGPGTYRELLTTTANGGNTYATGTVSVTNGSAVVTGSGTTFTGNVFANGIFQSTVLAHGTDGVANGTTTFTSAAGNFQAGHVGMTIRVNGKNAYQITARASATSITLSGSPASGSSLTYDVGPESPYEILSVDSNTQITLKQAWSGPTLTGLAYLTWKDIKFIGDEGGTLTDGIGGAVRITGSDDDLTATRAQAISCGNNYRTFRGLQLDNATTQNLLLSNCTNCIIDQCTFMQSIIGATTNGASQAKHTFQRCVSLVGQNAVVQTTHTATVDNAAILIQNCLMLGVANGANVSNTRIGGVTIRNCFVTCGNSGIKYATGPATGQAMSVHNCIVAGNLQGFVGLVSGDIQEDYNAVYNNGTARSTVPTGTHSNTDAPLIVAPLLTLGIHDWIIGMLLSASALGSIAGLNPPLDDMYGTARVATSSWGPVQWVSGQRPADSGTSRGRIG